MNGDYAGLAADVAELVIMRARDDLAAEAAHEAHARVDVVVRVDVGAWRRPDGVGGVGFDLRRVVRRHFPVYPSNGIRSSCFAGGGFGVVLEREFNCWKSEYCPTQGQSGNRDCDVVTVNGMSWILDFDPRL